MDLFYHRCAHGGGIGGRPRDVPAGVWTRAVEHDAAVDVQAVLFHRADNADDGYLSIRIVPEVLSDGVAVRPEAVGELLVDDADGLAVPQNVKVIKDPAFDQGNFHRTEVIGGRAALIDLQFL